LIEWTFDPLEVRNAYFNLNRLGAVCRRYLPNLYGVTTSPLHRGLRTDRLVAEWNLEETRVIAMVDSGAGEIEERAPSTFNSRAGEEVEGLFIRVPAGLPYTGEEISDARAVQDRLRAEFTEAFDRGYIATGVVRGHHPAYVLARALP
jgi:predicted GNAT superfamily acetyltransferase